MYNKQYYIRFYLFLCMSLFLICFYVFLRYESFTLHKKIIDNKI